MADAIKAGKTFDLTANDAILKINSPQDRVGGPYAVVFQHIIERWAIVAMDWEEKPVLGIRWFWDKMGNPISTAHPTWYVIPDSLAKNILAGLPLSHSLSSDIAKFLTGEIKGPKLKSNHS